MIQRGYAALRIVLHVGSRKCSCLLRLLAWPICGTTPRPSKMRAGRLKGPFHGRKPHFKMEKLPIWTAIFLIGRDITVVRPRMRKMVSDFDIFLQGKDATVSTHAQKWFDKREAVLSQEAELAGLLEHSTMIGTAREFMVKRVLKSIMPPSIHVGTGKVIDYQDNVSRQQDIVLFDHRFPLFEIDSGVGMYPLEGVIATIEVKSTLTHKEALQCLKQRAFAHQSDARYRMCSLVESPYPRAD